MARLKYNVAVKVGEYEAHGEKKNRYQRIGRIMESENGPFLLLDSLFISSQLFSLANKEGRDSIIASLFKEEPKEDSGRAATRSDTGGSSDIPF